MRIEFNLPNDFLLDRTDNTIQLYSDNNIIDNFVAIDFETANSARSSACTLGLVEYKGNQIVASKYWKFKPTPFKFDPINIRVTGLNPNDFDTAPDFCDVWKELEPYISNKLIVAHNASFDIDVLKKTLYANDISVPSFTYLCTYLMSKSRYDNLDNYRLDTLAQYLQLPAFNHHNALEDAKICGEIAKIYLENKTLRDIKSEFKIQIGTYSELSDSNNSCKLIYPTVNNDTKSTKSKSFAPYKYNKKASEDVINNYSSLFYKNDFLNNKHISITGDFDNFNRNEIISLLNLSDVTVHQTVTKAVSVLLLGKTETETSKYITAKKFIENGQKIDILSEDELLNLLNKFKQTGGDENNANIC